MTSRTSSLAKYDNKKTATNVSLFLSLTALSTLISSYCGGYLLNFLTVRQVFMVTAILPLLTLFSGLVAYEFKKVQRHSLVMNQSLCSKALSTWRKIVQYLKLPFIYKPIIFIFLVVIAPGVDDAMFYFNSNVLHFSNDEFALLNVIFSIGNIMGVWTYRLLFS